MAYHQTYGFYRGFLAVDLFSPKHLLIVALIVLLVFGTKKLRTIGSDLGQAVRGFKESMKDGERDAETPPTQIETRQITGQDRVAAAEKATPAPEKEKTTV